MFRQTADSRQQTADLPVAVGSWQLAADVPANGQRRTASVRPLSAVRCLLSEKGFTIAELITVVGIVAILASIALPVASFGIRRQKEIELREKLRKITEAIDRYHDLRLAQPPNNIKAPPDLTVGAYPKDLEELTKPIELSSGKSIRLLRERDLIDPMTNKKDWITLADTDEPDAVGSSGGSRNVFEVRSNSHAKSLDGKTHYNEW
jgi:prepilin-type N-terminal cleavage/methylation domain-containing protein